ncbi:MAG: hypothetical protein NDI77_00610 [Geobacteraceae bacterium]|nr:hypothetical protein [Geobacteraceae bacterium]
MNTPVLFLVFNRPDTTRQVFEAIRQAKPPRLYVAADGPRPDRDGERERCDEVRKIATAVDWPCEIKTLFRDINQGCKHAVSGAITWFFENEEEGIILEDDVIPGHLFFDYCELLLDKYRYNNKVMMISGCNPVAGLYESTYAYEFSNYAIVWGWASWRRAWKHYDVDLSKWPTFKKQNRLSQVSKVDKNFEAIWTEIYDKVYLGQIDTWDYQWFFSINYNNSFVAIPKYNLVSNIGYSDEATHTKGDMPDWVTRLKLNSSPIAINHPPFIDNNENIDRLIEKTLFGADKSTYIKYCIKKHIGKEKIRNARRIASFIRRMMGKISRDNI